MLIHSPHGDVTGKDFIPQKPHKEGHQANNGVCSVREKTTIYLAQRGQSFKPSASTDLGLREGGFAPSAWSSLDIFGSVRKHCTAWHSKAGQEVFASQGCGTVASTRDLPGSTLDPHLEKHYSTVQDSLKVPHFNAKSPHDYPGGREAGAQGSPSTPHTQHFTSQTFLALRRNHDWEGIQELHGVVGMAQKRHHRHLV